MLRKILACAALTPMLMACAPFAHADSRSISPEQASLVDSTCSQVMGLGKGESFYAECRESLTNTLAARQQGHDMAAAYKDCRQHGLAEGTPGFSTCMLDSNVTAPPVQPIAATYTGAPSTEPGKSFYSIPPRVQYQRERYSCAQLGLVPGTAQFTQCVADLQIAMLPTTN